MALTNSNTHWSTNKTQNKAEKLLWNIITFISATALAFTMSQAKPAFANDTHTTAPETYETVEVMWKKKPSKVYKEFSTYLINLAYRKETYKEEWLFDTKECNRKVAEFLDDLESLLRIHKWDYSLEEQTWLEKCLDLQRDMKNWLRTEGIAKRLLDETRK